MEKKSLNKKLQLNKETIAILDKEQQSQILGGEAVKTYDILCQPTMAIDCHATQGLCPPEKAKTLVIDNCVFSRNYCPTDNCNVTNNVLCPTANC